MSGLAMPRGVGIDPDDDDATERVRRRTPSGHRQHMARRLHAAESSDRVIPLTSPSLLSISSATHADALVAAESPLLPLQ